MRIASESPRQALTLIDKINVMGLSELLRKGGSVDGPGDAVPDARSIAQALVVIDVSEFKTIKI
jgi:hypothetical protein